MRNVNANILSGADYLTQTGGKVDSNQLVSASFQISFGDSSAAGTFKLQASNDINNDRYQADTFTPTNWTDVPNESASITGGASAILTIANMAYRWIRAVYTPTGAGVQTVAPIADTGVKQAQTITAVADVAGSLNSTYFLVSSINLTSKAAKNFYVWLDDGAGVDPAIAGRTGIQVIYTDGDTAATIAGLIRTAMAALTNDFTITGASTAVIVTSKACGVIPAATDGTAATGFTFAARSAIGVASDLNNKYFLLNSALSASVPTNYFIWLNVDTIGTAPVIAGRTAVPIAISSGDSAATIGTAIASAIDALANFTAAGTTTVTVTNTDQGQFTPMSDAGSTGFTFAVTAGGSSTVAVNINALSI